MSVKPVIGIIGGTGELGSGLAKAWSAAGYQVIIGSRTAEKASDIAPGLGPNVRGMSNLDAARAATVIVIAVPFASHETTLLEIRPVARGKIVVDAVVPLVPPKVTTVQLPAQGCAALMAQRALGDGVDVVAAFHNVGAAKLHLGQPVDCDVLVFGDSKEARGCVMELANAVASRGIDGGVLANAAAAEALTSVLIGLNRRYKIEGAGIRITGLPNPDDA